MKKLVLLMVLLLCGITQAYVVTNGDFETGDTTGWGLANTGTFSVVSDNGPSGTGIYAAQADRAIVYNLVYLNAAVATATPMTIEFDYKVAEFAFNDPAYGGGINWRVECYTAGFGQFISGVQDWAWYMEKDTWQTKSFDFIAPANTAILSIVFDSSVVQTGGVATLDNLTVVPEPATISILGTSLFFPLRRRKK